MRPASALRSMALAGAEIVAEGDAAHLAPHGPEPGRLQRHAGEVGGSEARRDLEAVADVALAVADELVVGGEDQRVVARSCGALGEFAGEAAVAEDEHLHPARGGAGRGERLEGADRAVAEAIGGARAGRRARGRAFAVGMDQPGETGRADDHRQRQALAEKGDREVAAGRAAQRVRQELDLVERRLVPAERASRPRRRRR